jgi:hypothetical protein
MGQPFGGGICPADADPVAFGVAHSFIHRALPGYPFTIWKQNSRYPQILTIQ